MDHFGEETVKKTVKMSKGVQLGIGIAVLLSVTAGVGYLYGSYVKERRNFERYGDQGTNDDDEEAEITEENDDYAPIDHSSFPMQNEMRKQVEELAKKIENLDERTKMAVIQLGTMIEQQAPNGIIDPECVAGIDNLVYDLGEKELLTNNETYKNMRRSLYEEILTNFKKSIFFNF